MAVFRVEKNKNYTVMSNYHLKDKTLSLKAKGLLSQMLSLPDDWNYTLEGLASLNKEKIDAIRTAVKELETAGYIQRSRARDEKGRLGDTIYVIHEQAQPIPDTPLPSDSSRTDSPCPPSAYRKEKRNEGMSADRIELYRNLIEENIGYEILIEDNDPAVVDEITNLIVETVVSNRKTIRIAKSDFPHEIVKSRFLKLTKEHIQYVIDGLSENTTKIRNMKAYLLTALWNAPNTITTHYNAQVNHDLSASNY